MYAVTLRPGQLAALAGLGALGHLDLELVGAGEVLGGHAEPGRGDLLDLRIGRAAVLARRVPGRVLAALAGVRGAAERLDPDREHAMGLGRERADAHRRHDEPARDGPRVLDLLERHGRRGAGAAHAEAVADERSLAMEGGAVGREGRVDAGRGVRGAGRGQRLEGARVGRAVEVELAVAAEAGEAGVGEPVRSDGGRERAGLLEPGQLHGREVRGLQAARPGRGGGEAAGDEVGSELERLEQLAADIARDRRDAHAREHLAQPGVEGGEHVRDRGLRRHLLRAARAGLLADELEQQARVDDARAGGDDHGEAVHVEHVAGIDREVRATRAGRPRRARCGRHPRRARTGRGGGPRRATQRHRTGRRPRHRPATRRGPACQAGRARPRGPRPRRWTATSRRACGWRGAGPGSGRGRRRAAPSRSTTTGRPTRTVAAPTGIPPSSAGRRPSSIWRSITARSRSGSIGGLVTCANAWRR